MINQVQSLQPSKTKYKKVQKSTNKCNQVKQSETKYKKEQPNPNKVLLSTAKCNPVLASASKSQVFQVLVASLTWEKENHQTSEK